MLLTYKENVHSTQMYIPLKPLFSRHKGIGVQFSDEPTGALDSETGVIVLSLLQKQSRDGKNTVILVTHNADIAQCADKVIRMKNGKIREVITNEHPLAVEEVEW